MAFPVRNYTSLKPGKPRYDQLAEIGQQAAEKFAAANPFWGKSTYITIRYSRAYGEYVASVKYTSNQGTTTVSTHTHVTQ